MSRLYRTAAAGVLAAAAPAIVLAVPAVPAVPAELAPGCQHAVISENSGNGPNLHVVICYALRRPADDHKWVLINDGAGRVDGGDVLLGHQVPGEAR
jgi:hypothetical protein